jgi:uncharacterized protein YjbJ (UPF0337 family)
MSISKKISHRAEAARGTAKKLVGRAAGNNRLRAEGRIDELTGKVKQAADRAARAVRR